MFCPGTATTLPAIYVPVTVAGEVVGHIGVPAGPPLFVQKNTIIPPGTCRLPKWIWACAIGEVNDGGEGVVVGVVAGEE